MRTVRRRLPFIGLCGFLLLAAGCETCAEFDGLGFEGPYEARLVGAMFSGRLDLLFPSSFGPLTAPPAVVTGSLASRPAAQEDSLVWRRLGPDGGLVLSLAVHPDDAETVYAAVMTGGAYRSTDGGASWELMEPEVFGGAFVLEIEADPADPSELLLSALFSSFRSTDGGTSWQSLDDLLFVQITDFLFDPFSPTIYAGAIGGVFRSEDGGASWEPASAGLPEELTVRKLAADPTTPGTLVAVTGDGLFATADGGASWSALSGPEGAFVGVLSFVADGSLFAGTAETGVFRSTDSGLTWSPTGAGLEGLVVLDLEPVGSTLYAATDRGVFASDDGGTSWEPRSQGLRGTIVLELEATPSDAGVLYAGTLEGVYRTADGGSSWQARHAGTEGMHLSYAVATHPANPSVLYAGTVGGAFKSTDGGATWSAANQNLTSPRVLALAVDPSSPATVWAGAFDGVFRSTDAAASWTDVSGSLAGQPVFDLAIEPGGPIYAMTDTGVFRTQGAGGSWTEVSGGLPARGLRSLSMDPTAPQILYAASRDGVYATTNGGVSWSAASAGLGGAQAVEVAVDPSDPDVLYAATAAGVFQSTDRGATWFEASSGLPEEPEAVPILAIAVDPAQPETVYAANIEGSVFRTDDGGATWFPWHEDSDLATLGLVALLVVDERVDAVYAATARGILGTSSEPVETGPCVADADTACLLGGRFKVEGTMKNFENPPQEFATRVMTFPSGRAESGQAVFFESFKPGNFEVGVKMVDGCGFPPGNPLRNYWVFVGGLTNADAEIFIEDTVTDEIYRWFNPSGQLAQTIGDTAAFPCVEGAPVVPCVPDAEIACLLGGRFAVWGSMKNFEDPPQEFSTQVMSFPLGRAESGQAVFFESFKPGNFEVGVKMVDGCGLPSGNPLRAFWVFYGGLTNAETRIRVTQLSTGLVDEWFNPALVFPQSVGRTQAFPCD